MPWWVGLALPLLAFVLTVLGFELAVSLRAAAHGLTTADAARQVRLDHLNLAALQAAGFGLAIVVGLALFQGPGGTAKALLVTPLRFPVALLCVIAGMAVQFPLAELANLVHAVFPVSAEEMLLQQRLVTPTGPWQALAAVLAIVVVAATTEEILFRGLLLPRLSDRYGTRFALGLTALAFGLVHVEPGAVVVATLAGLALGWVTLRTGSSLAAVALHGAVNALPLMLPLHVVRIPGFNTVGEGVYHLPVSLLFVTGVVATGAFLGIAKLTPTD